MTKKKAKPETKTAEDITFSPLMADRLWTIVKEVAANRAKELENDRGKTQRIFEVAESAKRDFIMKNYPSLMDPGGQLMADDVMAVLTTMTLLIANEVFEKNPEVMEVLRTPKTPCLKPHSHRDGNPLYV